MNVKEYKVGKRRPLVMVDELLKTAERDDDVLAVILYGSLARGERARDVDICLVLLPDKASVGFEKRIEYSSYKKLDVQVFQELPLYIRKRILEEGKVLVCKEEDLLYDIASETVREFEYFRPRYEEYLEGVLNG
jgi:predicted nucleotidyltransferase